MPPKSAQKGRKTPPNKRSFKRTKKETASAVPHPLPFIAEENADAKDEALVMDDVFAPLEAVEEEKVTKLEVAGEKIGGEASVSPMEGEIAPLDEAEEEKATKLEVVEHGTEKTLEKSTVEKIEGGTFVEEAVEDKGNGDQENDREEEVEEEEMEAEAEEEGDKQVVEDGAGKDKVECITAVDQENEEEDLESISGDDEENEEVDPSMHMQAPTAEIRRKKNFELCIAGLDKRAVDEDLITVFGVFGEIQSVRIVKHPLTQKSKGFAFIRYASIENAKKALAELKDGTEVKGKKIRIQASQDNDTLYLGNICRTWTRDRVLETLKGYGVEQIEDILLPDDPESDGNIKGFAFVEFKTHSDAMSAFQRLRKPDAVFGRNISAKVAFAQAPLHPCEEDLLKVKTVYLEGIPKSWDEGKVKELCKQYGEIERIQLSRNFTSARRKNFGFVEFSSRDGAVVCVDGMNNSHIGENVIVKASFAKPVYKSRLAKQTRGGYKVQQNGEATEVAIEEAGKSKKKNEQTRGGYKVQQNGEATELTIEEAGKSKKKNAKSKAVINKKEIPPNLIRSNRTVTSKSQDKRLKEKKGSQIAQSTIGNKRGRKGTYTAVNQQPSKKLRLNYKYEKGRGRSSSAFTNPRSSYSSNPYMLGRTTYAQTATSYTTHAHTGAYGSQLRRTDLEPHAGFLLAANRVQNPYAYEGRRAGAYDPRSSTGYLGASMVQSSRVVQSSYPVQNSHPGYSSFAGNQVGHVDPRNGAYVYPRSY